jgi:ABC-type uncharacterized transport system ATPase subunit
MTAVDPTAKASQQWHLVAALDHRPRRVVDKEPFGGVELHAALFGADALLDLLA